MRTLLIIEEDRAFSHRIKTILELAGYQVSLSHTGKQGVSEAARIAPNLVLSGMKFPDIDGFGLLHLIRKNEELEHVSFIFMASKTVKNHFRKAMEMGADDYITKPFSDLDLLNAVESRLNKVQRIFDHIQSSVNTTEELSYHHALKGLLENGHSSSYRKKEIIFSRGNYPQYLFYLKTGKVKSFMRSEEGKELTVQLYGPGDFIGYIALFGDTSYKITAQALTDCEVELISKSSFIELLKTNTAFSLEVIRVLARHNSQKADQMLQLAYNSLRKRVAQSLLMLKNKFSTDEKLDFSIQITREELANISGTTTESLIRTLSDFKTEKLITTQGRTIKIIDEKRLQAMPN